MYNKQSCRECGAYLFPHSWCSLCREYRSWVCGQCDRIEDYTHVNCKREIVIAKN